LEYKPSAAFNREHVIPQAFGRFGEGSPVLDCVCELCNGRLGRNSNSRLATQSVEGVHRFVAGLRPASKFRIAQASDVDGVLIKEGPLAGCIADFRPSPDETSVNMVPRPQVGFGKTREGPFQCIAPVVFRQRNNYSRCSGHLRHVYNGWGRSTTVRYRLNSHPKA